MSSFYLLIVWLGLVAFAHGQSVPTGSLANSSSGGDKASVGFYDLMTATNRKSYVVGLRKPKDGENICYGVLITPTLVLMTGCKQTYMAKPKFSNWFYREQRINYAVVGSLYNAGIHKDDGSETIEISKFYEESPGYSVTGYRAASIYGLETRSRIKPATLPASVPVNVPVGATLTTVGWADNESTHMMSLRNVDAVASSKCVERNIAFQDCICTVSWLASDGCNVVNGSPLIMNSNGADVVVGLRYIVTEACDNSGFPIAFTSFSGMLNWIKFGGKSAQAPRSY